MLSYQLTPDPTADMVKDMVSTAFRQIFRRDLTTSGVGAMCGRLWICCVACSRAIVVSNSDWATRRGATESWYKNGLAITECGRCEEQRQEELGMGLLVSVKLDSSMIRNWKAFRAIERHCESRMEKLDLQLDGAVTHRKMLLHGYEPGLVVKGVRMPPEERNGDFLEVTDEVELDYLSA